MGEVGAVAGDHGGQHDCVVRGEAQRRGQTAHGRGQRQQVRTGSLLKGVNAAGEEAIRRSADALNLGYADGCGRSDVLVNEEIRSAPDAWIVVSLGRQQANHGTDAIATLKWLPGDLVGRPADREAHAACDGRLHIFRVVDDFEGGDAEIDSLGGSFFVRRSGWLIGIGQALFEFAAYGAGVNDGAFNGAEQAVRERGEGRRGSRLDLQRGATGAEQQPQNGQRETCDALGA